MRKNIFIILFSLAIYIALSGVSVAVLEVDSWPGTCLLMRLYDHDSIAAFFDNGKYVLLPSEDQGWATKLGDLKPPEKACMEAAKTKIVTDEGIKLENILSIQLTREVECTRFNLEHSQWSCEESLGYFSVRYYSSWDQFIRHVKNSWGEPEIESFSCRSLLSDTRFTGDLSLYAYDNPSKND